VPKEGNTIMSDVQKPEEPKVNGHAEEQTEQVEQVEEAQEVVQRECHSYN
jgi:hypothetical protein